MANIKQIEASAATKAATGITHYLIDATNSWKAFGANGSEIFSLVFSKDAGGKSVLHINTNDRRVEITYSIEGDGNNFVIDAVVNSVLSKVAISKDGGLVGEGLKKTVDPAIHEMFHSIDGDLMTLPGGRHSVTREYSIDYCYGLRDAADAAAKAGDSFSHFILKADYLINCYGVTF